MPRFWVRSGRPIEATTPAVRPSRALRKHQWLQRHGPPGLSEMLRDWRARTALDPGKHFTVSTQSPRLGVTISRLGNGAPRVPERRAMVSRHRPKHSFRHPSLQGSWSKRFMLSSFGRPPLMPTSVRATLCDEMFFAASHRLEIHQSHHYLQ